MKMKKARGNKMELTKMLWSTKAALKNKFVLSSVILVAILTIIASVSYVLAVPATNVIVTGDDCG